jgi:hypothetical protein
MPQKLLSLYKLWTFLDPEFHFLRAEANLSHPIVIFCISALNHIDLKMDFYQKYFPVCNVRREFLDFQN